MIIKGKLFISFNKFSPTIINTIRKGMGISQEDLFVDISAQRVKEV